MKSIRILTVVWGVVLLVLGVNSLTQADPCPQEGCSITVNVNDELKEFHDGFLGNNILGFSGSSQHFERTGGGIWDPSQNVSTPEMLGYAQNIGVSYARFPGGCGVHLYNWKHTVGPVDQRPIDGNGEPITFGLPEFLQYSEDVGALPVITVSDYTGTYMDGADLVEYLNASCIVNDENVCLEPAESICSQAYTDNNWRQLRVCDKKALNRSDIYEPWNVKWFEYGNESYHDNHLEKDDSGYKKFTAAEYADNYLDYRSAMREVDSHIKLGAPLYFPVLPESLNFINYSYELIDWSKEVISRVGHKADFFIVHNYVMSYPGCCDAGDNGCIDEKGHEYWPICTDADDFFRAALVSTNEQTEDFYRRVNNLIYHYTGRGDVPVAVTEFNNSILTDPYRYSLGNALLNADHIRQLMHADNIKMANYWAFSEYFWGMIFNNTRRPNYYPFMLYHQHFGDTLVSVQVTSDKYTYVKNDGVFDMNYRIVEAQGDGQIETLSEDDLLDNISWDVTAIEGASVTGSQDGILTIIFNNTDVKYEHAKKTVTLDPDKWYRMEGKIRTTDIESAEGIYMAVQSNENLMTNPGFQNEWDGWNTWVNNDVSCEIDTSGDHKSAKVTFNAVDTNFYHINQFIPVSANTTYVIEGYIKANLETEGLGAEIEVVEYNNWNIVEENGGNKVSYTTNFINTNGRWIHASKTFTTSAETNKLRIALRRRNDEDAPASISGTAWWDDIRLTNMETNATKIINGTTEGSLDGYRYLSVDFNSPSVVTDVDVLIKRNQLDSINGTAEIRDVSIHELTPTTKYGAVPYLSVNASKSQDGTKVYLMVINKHMTSPISSRIILNDFTPLSAQAWTLNGDSVISHDENDVDVYYSNIGVFQNGDLLEFPPHSLTALEISREN